MDQMITEWKKKTSLLCKISSYCDCYMLCGQSKNCNVIYVQQDIL